MDDEGFLRQMVEGKTSSYINIGCWLQESMRYHQLALPWVNLIASY